MFNPRVPESKKLRSSKEKARPVTGMGSERDSSISSLVAFLMR